MAITSPTGVLLGSQIANDPNASDDMLAAKMAQVAPDSTLNSMRAAFEEAKAFTNKAYDAKARLLREARIGPTGMERLRAALTAAATPTRGGSNWDALRQGLAAWDESGTAAREAEEKQRLGLMGLESERNMSLAELAMKYKPEKGGEPNISLGVAEGGAGYRKIQYPDGSGAIEYPGGYREVFGPEGSMARAGGAAGGAPAGGAPVSNIQAPPGAAVGSIFTGQDGKQYRVNAFGKPEPVVGGSNRPATAEEAKSYGYLRGRFEDGSFKGDEADKLPSAEALNAEIIRDENRIEQITNTLQTAKELLPKINWSTAGLVGSVLRFVPGSESATVYNTLMDTIGGNIAFDRLQQMREESKTGGALGQVAVAELDALKGSIASLKVSNKPEQLKANLEKVLYHYERSINAYNRMLADKRARMQSLYGGGQGGASAAPAATVVRERKWNPKTRRVED